MDRLPGILKEDGYPDVQAFKRLYDEATILVEQYNRDLAAWERQAEEKKKPKREKPPEKESIIKQLRLYDAEAKRNNQPRRKPKQRSYDMER